MNEILLAHKGHPELDMPSIKGMYELRHAVFHDRLGWDVTSDNGMEYDIFDQANPTYVLVKDKYKGDIKGCWRLLPSTGPYMLKDTFPQLLHGQAAPQKETIWELSRFALARSSHEVPVFGLGEISVWMLQTVVQFALQNNIERYITVTTVAIERLMNKLGLNIHRFGPPIRIGNVMTVACWFYIDRHTEAVALGQIPRTAKRAA